jgi:hypothetical protein
MNAQPGIWSRWPKWVRTVFSIFGILFIFAAIRFVAGLLSEQYTGYGLGNDATGLRNFVIVLEFLLVLLVLQLIVLTLRQGRNGRTIALSIFYGLVLILSVIVFEVRFVLYSIPLTGGGGPDPNSFTLNIAAITGLITAISALYGQILSGRKMNLDMGLAQRQLNARQDQPVRTTRKVSTPAKKPARRSTKK